MEKQTSHQPSFLEKEYRRLNKENEELQVIKIYTQARDHLVRWVAFGTLLITAFGLYSINSATNSIAEKIEEKATERIIHAVETRLEEKLEPRLSLYSEEEVSKQIETKLPEITDKIVRNHITQIAQAIKDELDPKLQSHVDEQLQMALQDIAEEIRNESDSALNALAELIEQKSREKEFYVTVASFPEETSLRSEVPRFKRRLRHSSINESLQIMFCASETGNGFHSIVIGPSMTISHAQEAKRAAIAAGFRSDSFVSKSWRYEC